MPEITIIVNDSSGSASVKAEALEEMVARTGLGARIERVRGSEVAPAAERAAAPGSVLVAAGGDGTVSTVASVAMKAGSTFGVIPLGTLNHFARDVGIPVDIGKAVETIAAGKTRILDMGELNGSMFVNNISFGLYPHLVWEREQEQCRGRSKWSAFVIALVRTWRRHPTVAVRMTVDDVALERRTPFVFIGNGVYRAEGLGLGTRSSLSGGKLSVYLAPGLDRFELLAMPVRALVGRLGPGVKFEAFTTAELTIETRRPDIDVTLDGELRSMRSPIRCAVRPGALRTLVPEAT